jgi:hypothetical protein
MKIAGKSLAVLLLVGILISSCAGQPEGSATPDVGASLTAGVGTIVAYFFETQTAMAPPATSTASITPSPQPSGSPIAFPTLAGVSTATPNLIFLSPTPTGTIFTATPNAGSLAYGCNNMAFVRDVETPDGTVLRPNESFTRTWKVANSGTCNWLHGYRLVPVGGFGFAEDPVSVHGSPIVTPTEWREISVHGQAPDDPGTYTQSWRMSDGAGHLFGATLSISITVRAPTNTPNPPTATNTTAPPPPPTITSISPTSAQVGATVNLTITGSGFASGATVSFEGGQGTAPQVTTTTVSNATTISITVTMSGNANEVWNVRVTNPNNSTAVLPGAFTVTP